MLTLRERLLIVLLLLAGSASALALILLAPATVVSLTAWTWVSAMATPPAWGPSALCLLLWLLLAWAALGWALRPLRQTLRTLEGTVLSYRDGDFSMTLRSDPRGELRTLLQLHHDMGLTLRQQRQQLAQRELLLDTLVQHTPVALLLIDAQGQVVYGNLGARHLLGAGRKVAGQPWQVLLDQQPPALREALAQDQDQLVTVDEMASGTQEAESYHLSPRPLSLLGQPHRLVLMRRLTRELSRQEVASWKRVIRVLSHELNNSLAPISSLAHSAAELCRRGQTERAADILLRISTRTQDLHGFLSSYASVAKLPLPRPERLDWPDWVNSLQSQFTFLLDGPLPQEPAWLDRAQLTQACLNLLKNAHEAGGPAEAVSLSVRREHDHWLVRVDDRGPGMSETVLAQALLPFYSTKRSGTGLGLALVREIAEAHGGRVHLSNRDGGGLTVQLRVSAQLRPAS